MVETNDYAQPGFHKGLGSARAIDPNPQAGPAQPHPPRRQNQVKHPRWPTSNPNPPAVLATNPSERGATDVGNGCQAERELQFNHLTNDGKLTAQIFVTTRRIPDKNNVTTRV